MKYLKLNGAKLAAEVGVTPTAVSRYRQGRIPGAEELLRLAKALKVSAKWLVTGEGPKNGLQAFTGMLGVFSKVAQQYEPKNPEPLLDRLTEAADPLLEALHDKAEAAEATGGEWQARAQEAEKRLERIKGRLEEILKEESARPPGWGEFFDPADLLDGHEKSMPPAALEGGQIPNPEDLL